MHVREPDERSRTLVGAPRAESRVGDERVESAGRLFQPPERDGEPGTAHAERIACTESPDKRSSARARYRSASSNPSRSSARVAEASSAATARSVGG